MKYFESPELLATGKDQKLNHNLGEMPKLAIICPSSMNYSPYTMKDPNQFVAQGLVDSANSLRKRDVWPIVMTDKEVTVKVVAGKKFKVVLFA